MADANTTTYAIVKPEVGASADTWGTKLNTDMDDVDALLTVLTTAGGTTAYTLTSGLSLAAYVSGQSFLIKMNATNTGASTLNVDSLGAKDITKNGSTALIAGDLVSGVVYRVAYDGTRFQVVAGAALDATLTALAALSIADNVLIRGTGADAFEVIVSTPIAQRVSTQTGAVATGTTTIPYDDSIPQSTEGDQYLSQAITPKNASNILVIEADLWLSMTGAGFAAVALFQDSTANALAATAQYQAASGYLGPVRLRHVMTAGTTSATTFKIRAGPESALTMTFNGQAGARKYGGVISSSLSITEIWA